MKHETSLDAMLPADMAEQAERIGERKASLDAARTFVLAVLAGAFIALGAAFSTAVVAGGGAWPYGIMRLVAGLAFSLGLVMVVVGGAELFTGNNLLVMAWCSKRITTLSLLRNWMLVYAGNMVGAMATAALVVVSRQHAFGGGSVGVAALRIAVAKCELDFVQAVALGMLCNALVCLAVWLSFSARTTTDRILSVMGPVAAFVACGFEHSIANAYFIPLGLWIQGDVRNSELFASTCAFLDLSELTWEAFFVRNLLPVTLGNILGGAVMVGAVYWFVYGRKPFPPRDEANSNQPHD